MGSKTGGIIHSLGLPRMVVAKIFSLLESNESDEEIVRIFGKAKSYKFLEDERLLHGAPYTEFGQTGMSKNRMEQLIFSLPQVAQEVVRQYKIGLYKDILGRYYKRETEEAWSVLVEPKSMDKFPYVNEVVQLEHVFDSSDILFMEVKYIDVKLKRSALVVFHKIN